LEFRAELGYHRRGWRGDHGGHARHGGGGGAATPDLTEKEAKRHMVRMVLGGGAMDVMRIV
jgi:hypothetical protein